MTNRETNRGRRRWTRRVQFSCWSGATQRNTVSMWSAVTPGAADAPAPASRAKHSATLLGGHVYLLGGRNGNLPLKDFWKYNLVGGRWQQLVPNGEQPPCLQEHSAVAYKDCIYVFGGEVGFSAGTETPLWVYSVKTNSWRKVRTAKGLSAPRGRRGHTALVHSGVMLIYGGYRDLRGSSSELWAFHFDSEMWYQMSVGTGETPPARHKHSAVLHDDAMWVYGGMTDLQERSDFWRYDTVSKTWTNIKAKPGPGPLHSHAACRLPSSMLLFGGERDGHPINELWRFHFGTETWERLQVPGLKPQPRAESVALAVSELLLRDNATNALPCHTSILRTHRTRGGGSVDRCSNPRHSSYHPNNKVSPCERKYVFRPTSDNYVDGSNITTKEQSKCAFGPFQAPVASQYPNNVGFLKEISKLSQINLSRLSHHKCSYSVLTSSSHDDSTESLLLQHSSTIDGSNNVLDTDTEEGTPNKKTMVKSQSANIISRNQLTITSSSCATPDSESSIFNKHSDSTNSKNMLLNSENSDVCSSLSRDPVSVPNFGTFMSIPPPTLTPVEVTRMVFLDPDDDFEDEVPGIEMTESADRVVKVQPFSSNRTTDFTNIHQYFQPGLHSSDKCQANRSDSYTSHLLSVGNCDTAPKDSGIPKSASVRFNLSHQTSELSDETVSTSDYASIEAVNKITSGNEYKTCPAENNYVCGNNECSNKFVRVHKGKLSGKVGPFGFSNPNYLGPDIQTILQRNTPSHQFQSYAQLLNSPPDSVLEDGNGRSISRQFFQEELLELQSISQPTTPGIPSPHFPGNGSPERRKKIRASSASRAERQQEVEEDVSSFGPDATVPLYMFILGGKEQGQVTVFKRPVSVWRLQLAPNIF